MTTHTATVETLTAEVRVLMVGSRQVTLSVFRQLDFAGFAEIEPFGRVSDTSSKPGEKYEEGVLTVGRRYRDGALVRGWLPNTPWPKHLASNGRLTDTQRLENDEHRAIHDVSLQEWKALPLIVLAGLR